MKEILINKQNENQRVDKFVRKYLNEAPLSFIYHLFRKKDVKVNGHWVKQDYILTSGEILTLYVSDEQLSSFIKTKEIKKSDLKYPIVYEDDNILIINKPRGLLVHGDKSEKRLTLTNEVLNYLYFKGEYDPKSSNGFIPAPAHRLDRNTSGLVVFGKNLPSLQLLEQLFKEKNEIIKTYQALVVGTINQPLEIDKPLLKDSTSGLVKVGKIKDGALPAFSKVTPIKQYNGYTLVNVVIFTGRTHQIRVHLASVSHPIVGDGKYGDFQINREFKNEFGFENQFLHAYSLEFKNISGILSYLSNKKFKVDLPKIEKDILNKLS